MYESSISNSFRQELKIIRIEDHFAKYFLNKCTLKLVINFSDKGKILFFWDLDLNIMLKLFYIANSF